MEQISNIASRQVNFKSQIQTKTSPIEAVKNKIEDMEDKEKITVGLSALGVLSLAALAIAKRPHKVAEVIKDTPVKEVTEVIKQPLQKAAEAAGDVVEDVVKKYPKVEIGHTPKVQKQQEAISQGVERAIEATKEYVQGGNYGEVRANATKNLSHDGKMVVKGTLDRVHSAKVSHDISSEHQLADMVSSASSNAAVAKNTRQGMQNASRQDVRKKLSRAFDSAYEAETKALEANKKAQEIGTKKAKKSAKIASNQADRAQAEYNKTEQKAIARRRELAQIQAQKEANIAQQMASPGFEDGQIKQMLNADKGAKTRLTNLIKKKTAHGKMSVKQALELIINDAKETDLTRKLAQEELAKL